MDILEALTTTVPGFISSYQRIACIRRPATDERDENERAVLMN